METLALAQRFFNFYSSKKIINKKMGKRPQFDKRAPTNTERERVV
jgi:hypothetical protein